MKHIWNIEVVVQLVTLLQSYVNIGSAKLSHN